MKPLVCYMIAGEVSGDRLAAGIMRELKAQPGDVKFYGVGGPHMQAEGLESLFPYDELALMGFVEVLPKAMHLLGRIGRTVEDIELKKPDVVVTIDSPGFNFRVVKKARQNDIQTKYIHIVAPTVWAYKEKRAEKCAKLFDHMCVLLPFEPPYFEKHGLKTSFIGHPTVAANRHAGDGAAFRKKHHIGADQTVIALLPGSRENEIKRHMAVMSQTIDLVAKQHGKPIIVSSAPPHLRELMQDYLMTSPYRSILAFDKNEKMDAFAAADVALVKSGTVSLEMAYANTPMVVMYRANPITAAIVKKLIKVDYVSLVNIILKQEVIPEFLQENATPQKMSDGLLALLSTPSKQQAQHEAFKRVVHMLRKNENIPAVEAANIIRSKRENNVSCH